MPKRENDFWASQKEGLRYCVKHKRYYRADIGCQLCMFERLGTRRKGEDNPRLQKCPNCHRKSLFYSERTHCYECLNLKCKRTFTEAELKDLAEAELPPEKVDKGTSFSWKVPSCSTVMRRVTRIRRSRSARNVFRAIVRLFASKLFLSLLVIGGLVDILRRAYILFTHHAEPIRGTIIFVVEVGLWFWLISILRTRKYRYKRPRFRLVFLAAIAIALVCALAGIQPLSSYKDRATAWVSIHLAEVVETVAELGATPKEEQLTEELEVLQKYGYPRITDIRDIERSPSRGAVIAVTFEATPETKPGYYYIELGSSEEGFGTQAINWQKYTQVRTLEWHIEPNTQAFTELVQGKPCTDVFRVDIYSINEMIVSTPPLVGLSSGEGEGREIPPIAEPEESVPVLEDLSIPELERLAFELINAEREQKGVPPTKWDDRLYELSRAHTQKMADRGELFHSVSGSDYGENCWGGGGYHRYSRQELARVIVDSWMSSPLHRAWLLHAPIRESVVSIVITPEGQYASWSFWICKLGSGPKLVEDVFREYEESAGGMPWIEWLYMKGYLK